MRLLAVLAVVLLTACLPITRTTSSGIGHPAGPTLDDFGLLDALIVPA